VLLRPEPPEQSAKRRRETHLQRKAIEASRAADQLARRREWTGGATTLAFRIERKSAERARLLTRHRLLTPVKIRGVHQ
jgi:hypothetical protein